MNGSATLALALALSLAACSSREQPSRPRGLTPEEVPAPSATPPTSPPPERVQPPPSALPSPFAQRAPDPGALMNRDATVGSASGEVTDAAVDAGPPRDLGAELAARIGQPVQCVDMAAIVAGGGKLSITARAQVMPSGRITRATVTAPGQPAQATTCIERLVTAASLASPVPDAPREVSTTVVMQVVATPP
jgi:hypothetical protein